MGLEKLWDFLLASLRLFQFFDVVDAYERGVVLRFGRFQREVKPGLVWLLPFAIDRLLVDNVVPRVCSLGEQTLTTADGRTITLVAVVTANIADIAKALLEVEHMDDALRDSCTGEVGRVVSETTWDDLWHGKASPALTAACRRRAKKYGIEITAVQLSELAPCKPIRLWTH